MNKEIPAGFQLPLYRSLTEQILLAGAPKNVIVFNAMIGAFFLMTLHFIWILPFNVLIYFGSIYCTSQIDEQFFACLLRYIRKKDYYST